MPLKQLHLHATDNITSSSIQPSNLQVLIYNKLCALYICFVYTKIVQKNPVSVHLVKINI